MESLLDDISWRILNELQRDARLSYSELGRRINMSAPAVAERVRRMEEAGIITGYHATVDPYKVGATMTVFIRMTTVGGNYDRLTEIIQHINEILECHRLTGSDCFIMKAVVSSIAHLESLIQRLVPLGSVNISVILSSPVKRHTITKPISNPSQS
ncbi:Lrp/AsnC family transcriptional regulator [Alicyclobacillus shizuokensis]|uniref:Lrp/AsnC family transcriptional regulator n=1 Tax=Alicyclobacillus shizuokensis TaxID=392014 RepID=UPI0008375EC7|nr:Lrp/AsnC family transcriptional regulator [Alicyclobacillus shizuokensis]